MNEREFSESKTKNRREGVSQFLKNISQFLPENSIEVVLNIKYDDGDAIIVVIEKQFIPEK